MRPDWDVVVVGAGPAGAAAALGALHTDPALRVLLLDRADFPRDKSCGDGIAPHVFDALATVGVHDVAEGWEPLHRLTLARGSRAVSRPLARPVWVIPRRDFDARLVRRAVDAGAVLRRHRVRQVAGEPGAVVVDGEHRGAVVVGADGAHSVTAQAATSPPGNGRRALAIRGYAPTPPGRRGTQLIRYGDRRQPSYAWSFDRGDGLANVGYGELVGGTRPRPGRDLMLAELERLLPGSTAGATGWKAHHLPLSGWRAPRTAGRVLLAGDAAGLVNPMTGEGIYYAVATGILAGRTAAEAVAAGRPERAGDRHSHRVRELLGRHLHHTWAAARLSTSPTVIDAGIGLAARHQAVFDDLVELGLGRGRITPRLAGGLGASLAGGLGTSMAGGLVGNLLRPTHRK